MTTFNFNTLCAGRSLTTEESQALFTQVFEGKIDPALLAGILTALKIKGETPEEIEGAARAMVLQRLTSRVRGEWKSGKSSAPAAMG